MQNQPSEINQDINSSKLRRVAVVFLTCVSGWFIMELEILGVRILTPYFGSAVYVVMGSVIGVFLLSLSAGYMLGGWLSKQDKNKLILGFNFIIAGAWLCAIPFFAEPVCDGILLNFRLNEKWGSLLASFIMFGMPTLLLGTVSPTAVRWLTKKASNSGLNTGLVLAFSTIASFAACIVSAFYLVLVSIRKTIFISGFVLIVLGTVILLQAIVPYKDIKNFKTGENK